MALATGTRLGAYEITDQIGVGGMGEVYRATDTKLKREVAIKVLPEAFVEDADRLARFQREAEVLASLNHPNIATIHGLEKADGQTVIVMELVEGPTLADRIKEGPIPPDEALGIARQVADALEAAHGRQIVHRDLKPANIKLKPDGTVKVLDFGISKPIDARAISGGQSPAMTTPAMTETGVILGTAAYMSPEQARGRPVDERTDIWAFGCLLFEMLTGQPAFGGEDVMATLARVIDRDTDMSSMPGPVSPAVRHTIKLCLEKDPQKRIADIRDVRLALEGAFEAEFPSLAAVTTIQPLWRRVWPVATALIVGALLASFLVWAVTRPPAPLVTRFAVPPPAAATITDVAGYDAVISPDGRQVAFLGMDMESGQFALYLRDIDRLESRLISGTEAQQNTGNMNPFFSADGEWIGFRSAGEGIMRVAVNGGPPVKILDDVVAFLGGAPALDGTVIVSAGDALYRVSAGGGGTPERLTPESAEGAPYIAPVLLPGERAVLFHSREGQSQHVAALDLETGEQKKLIEDGHNVSYAPTGHIVFARGSTLMAAPFDVDRLEVTGDPVAVLQGVRYPGLGSAADYGLSKTGTLVYISGSTTSGRSVLVWTNRDGSEEPLLAEPRAYEQPRLSPDNSRLAFSASEMGQNVDVWTYDLTRGIPTRLTFDPARDSFPLWTPDGQRIVFWSDRDGGGLFWQAADGTGQAERLTQASPGEFYVPTSFLPDATGLVYYTQGAAGPSDLYVLSIDDDQTSELLVGTEFDEDFSDVSPDGRWLAYSSDESGQDEVYVRPFPNVDEGKWQVSTDFGIDPVWAPQSRELFYRSRNALMVVSFDDEPTFSPRLPEEVFTASLPASLARRGSYDVSLSGQRFVMYKDAVTKGTQLIVVQNWFEELKRLVPTE